MSFGDTIVAPRRQIFVPDEYLERKDIPPNERAISCKWVYRIKENDDSSLRYKARLVFCGFEQTECGEAFAPVPKLPTIRMLFALAASHDWDIWQMDVVTAFLHPTIDENVYMELPEAYGESNGMPGAGHAKVGSGRYVCKLKQALYGLKQAPRAWYSDIDKYLTQTLHFRRSELDANLYIMQDLHLLLWVDDILLFALATSPTTSASDSPVQRVKGQLSTKYRMKDLGEAKSFIGIQIERDRPKLIVRLHQQKHIEGILDTFGMTACNGLNVPLDRSIKLISTASTESTELNGDDITRYQSIVGKLIYAMIATRPDLAFAVSTLGRFNAAPNTSHLEAAKKTFRYLRRTSNVGLMYSPTSSNGKSNELIGFCDSDWAGDLDSRRSTTGYVFMISNGAISWKSRRQQTVALSSTEAEYMAVTDASKEGIWLRSLYRKLSCGIHPSNPNNRS